MPGSPPSSRPMATPWPASSRPWRRASRRTDCSCQRRSASSMTATVAPRWRGRRSSSCATLRRGAGRDRVYVSSPDRLARRYAYQVLLVDELQRAGVEIVFLNRPIGTSAEDDLLLQVQGMVAEYERAQILERSRRGKRHAALAGSVNVLVAAPYGYRYVRKQDGGGVARYEIIEEQAQVVRQIFGWVGRDRLSIGEVCRRLQRQGCPTPQGKPVWDRTTVWRLLKNPAFG